MQRTFVAFVSVIALLSGFYLSARYYAEPVAVSSQVSPPPGIAETALLGRFRPDFELANNQGEVVNADDFSGKVLLINFWATWCEPCRHEIPMLVDLQSKYGLEGLQVVGIALDNATSVHNFVRQYRISYPILVGETDVFETSAAYGNTEGVLPYSILVDKTGIVRWQYAGKIRYEDINKQLTPLL